MQSFPLEESALLGRGQNDENDETIYNNKDIVILLACVVRAVRQASGGGERLSRSQSR